MVTNKVVTDKAVIRKVPSNQQIRRTAKECYDFLGSQDFLDALSAIARDPKLASKARINPRKVLRARGVEVPQDCNISIEETVLMAEVQLCASINLGIFSASGCITFEVGDDEEDEEPEENS